MKKWIVGFLVFAVVVLSCTMAQEVLLGTIATVMAYEHDGEIVFPVALEDRLAEVQNIATSEVWHGSVSAAEWGRGIAQSNLQSAAQVAASIASATGGLVAYFDYEGNIGTPIAGTFLWSDGDDIRHHSVGPDSNTNDWPLWTMGVDQGGTGESKPVWLGKLNATERASIIGEYNASAPVGVSETDRIVGLATNGRPTDASMAAAIAEYSRVSSNGIIRPFVVVYAGNEIVVDATNGYRQVVTLTNSVSINVQTKADNTSLGEVILFVNMNGQPTNSLNFDVGLTGGMLKTTTVNRVRFLSMPYISGWSYTNAP